jgi:hypothetical protein
MGAVDVVSPTGLAPREVKTLAPRPPSLAGRRIGVLDNSKPNAGVLLGRLAERLAAATGARVVGPWRKPGSACAADDLDEIAAAADVVLTGSAD